MDNTGRIKKTLRPGLSRVIFGEHSDDAISTEMTDACSVDRAHVMMLVRVGLLDTDRARRILRAIDELERVDFAPLRGQHAPRGLYILYEDYLIRRLGVDTGGMMQLGRSRNDRSATIFRLRLRRPLLGLSYEVVRLIQSVLRASETYADAVMPIYTHFQPAFPTTYGHYLSGIGLALCRDLSALLDAANELNRCPLGAGAVGGTSLSIDTRFTAELLGFSSTTVNSIDAVASRDCALRLLSAGAILSVTLSRFATDCQLWSMQEFAFLEFPDDLVGSSSMMPQKRNVYILEHVQGRTATAVGALTTALMGMRSTPFTNSIAVGTEAASHVWGALTCVRDCAYIMRYVVRAARPDRERMKRRAQESFSVATFLAEQMVRESDLSFRSVHHDIGAAIAEELGRESIDLERVLDQLPTALTVADLDLHRVVCGLRYGGGAGAATQSSESVRQSLNKDLLRLRGLRHAWMSAQKNLRQIAEAVVSGQDP